jgi:hypothetical protein
MYNVLRRRQYLSTLRYVCEYIYHSAQIDVKSTRKQMYNVFLYLKAWYRKDICVNTFTHGCGE